MIKLTKSLQKGKYISLFAAIAMLFTYLADIRYYLNDNIYKGMNLGNLGGLGGEINLSILFTVIGALGYLMGVLLVLVTRKRLKGRASINLFAVAGLMAIIFLLFTPYNLQLLMPTQNMQNIAMINCIAVMVFSFADIAVLSMAINSHLAQIIDTEVIIGRGIVVGITVLSIILALLTTGLRWSFAICVAVYASVLLFVNIIHSIFYKDSEGGTACMTINKAKGIVISIESVVVLVLLVGGYFIVEPLIAIIG